MIYHSKRVGKNGKVFELLKFRTFKKGLDGGLPTASMNDPRLSRVGKWLRRFKADELPTLINLVRGQIAIIGPRPDTIEEVATLDERTRKIVLSVKPGIISPATLWNQYEDETLSAQDEPHHYYTIVIKPVKYLLNVYYVQNRTIWYDLRIMLAFIFRYFGIPPKLWKIYPPNFGKMNE